MKFIAQVIEQLEEARIQIDKQTSTGSRLALILTDNVFEILMYQFVRNEFSWDEYSFLEPKYAQKTKDKVLNHFPDKTKFINRIDGPISNDQVIIINIIHQFRNEAYHVNIIRNSIIHQIVKLYFQTCCELVPELWDGRCSYSSEETDVFDILSKFGIKGYILSKEEFKEVISYVCENTEFNQQELSNVLKNDINNRIKSLRDDLNYIESGSNKFPYDFLTWIQFCEEYSSFKSWKEVGELMKSFKPKITESTINSWERQANTLETESSIAKLLSKYSSIDKQLIKIEPIVDQAVAYYDQTIDNQIDEYLLEQS